MTLTDTLPANTTFVSASDGGVLAGGVVTWSIGSVPVGPTVTRTVTVQVNDPLPAGVTSITNTATVTDDGANGADPTPANNTDTDIDSLATTPDLVVTKTDGVTSASPGDTLIYTLTISNAGHQDATGVTATRHAAGQHHLRQRLRRRHLLRRRGDLERRRPGRAHQRHAHRDRPGGQHRAGGRDLAHQHGHRHATTAPTAPTRPPRTTRPPTPTPCVAAPDLVVTKTDGADQRAAGADR